MHWVHDISLIRIIAENKFSKFFVRLIQFKSRADIDRFHRNVILFRLVVFQKLHNKLGCARRFSPWICCYRWRIVEINQIETLFQLWCWTIELSKRSDRCWQSQCTWNKYTVIKEIIFTTSLQPKFCINKNWLKSKKKTLHIMPSSSVNLRSKIIPQQRQLICSHFARI